MMPHKKPQRGVHREDYAIVLDVLVENKGFKDSELIQAIGTKAYTLLELAPKPGIIVKQGDKVYIGDGKRDEIQYIKRAIPLETLSSSARGELDFVIEDLINEKEEEFVGFFNTAGPITIRKHSLELIPGLGKKHLQDMLAERDEKPFESFKDISERCPYLSDPQKALTQRIIHEIEDSAEFRIFVRR